MVLRNKVKVLRSTVSAEEEAVLLAVVGRRQE